VIFGKRTIRDAALDLTPMIDVTLQLIIFFMFTSEFVSAVRQPLTLPDERGGAQRETQQTDLVIDVRADGTIFIDGVALDGAGLAQALQRETVRTGGSASSMRVLVRADAQAKSGAINAVAQVLANLGVRGWRLGTSGVPHAGGEGG
jgi:biopolymer transport protein ExbD